MKYRVRIEYEIKKTIVDVQRIELTEEEVARANAVDIHELGYVLCEKVDVEQFEYADVDPQTVVVYDWSEVE